MKIVPGAPVEPEPDGPSDYVWPGEIFEVSLAILTDVGPLWARTRSRT